MQLVKLEIKGFKSFGDKVTINFDKGITGIVGPNGCGKSNIVDAIRWVLGEQKAKALRSDKMGNVIFNGTKKRKALQMAEVSLLFDNTKNLLPTEYTQVQITRRYYRSGESEYLLNGVTCRLKDISNLFLDTGIGSDSYAIIELKMIDDILNDKDNSRRHLFEEAAGISKFKVRKKQTLKKLEDTDKDLERVEDVLYEIEKNLKALEKQAKQAEKYLEFRDEHKRYSIELAKLSIAKHQEKLENLSEKLVEHQDLKTKKSSHTDVICAAIEKEKSLLLQKEKLLASRQKTLNDFVNEIRQDESDKKIKFERSKYLNDKKSDLKENINRDKSKIAQIEGQLQGLLETLTSAEKMLLEIELRVDNLKGEHLRQKENTKLIQDEISALNKEHKDQQDKVYQLKQAVEVNEIRLNSLQGELEKASQNTTSQQGNIKGIEEQLGSFSKQLDKKNTALEVLEKDETANETAIGKKQKEIATIKDELVLLNRKIDSKENEYNLTKSLVDNLEGFPEAIKFLKQNSKIGEVTPLLSDIITCDEKYRIAIENYLEQVMSYYVVQNADEAYQAVNILSERGKGKAHFYVLNAFNNFKPTPPASVPNTFLAIDLVEYDSKYQKLVSYILDDVYLSESDDFKESTHTIITQSGKIAKKTYSIFGGSVGLFEGKRIGRAKNIEKLQELIKDWNNQREQIKTNLDRTQNDLFKLKNGNLKSAIDESRKDINKTNQEYVITHLKLEQLQSQIKTNKNKKQGLSENIGTLKTTIQDSYPVLNKEKEKLQEIDVNTLKSNDKANIQNELLTQKSNDFNKENIVLHQQQNQINSFRQELNYKKEAQQDIQKQIQKNSDGLIATENDIIKLLETNEASDEELQSKYEEKESIEKGVNEAEKDYYITRSTINDKEENLRQERSNKDKVDVLIMETQNTMNETRLALTSISDRLSVEFNVNLNQLNIGEDVEKKLSKNSN
jgi:chromosome segregation protein